MTKSPGGGAESISTVDPGLTCGAGMRGREVERDASLLRPVRTLICEVGNEEATSENGLELVACSSGVP